jgi:hypothetical protein
MVYLATISFVSMVNVVKTDRILESMWNVRWFLLYSFSFLPQNCSKSRINIDMILWYSFRNRSLHVETYVMVWNSWWSIYLRILYALTMLCIRTITKCKLKLFLAIITVRSAEWYKPQESRNLHFCFRVKKLWIIKIWKLTHLFCRHRCILDA